MNELRIALIQTTIYWEDPGKNRSHFENICNSLTGKTDLIVLPETFTTGFTMTTEKVAEEMGGQTLEWLGEQAARTNSVITGSLIIKEGSNYFNRLIWMPPYGKYAEYDKKHLFRMGNEHHNYAPGTGMLIQDLGPWRIRPLICYDLRFPVWSRNRNNYDMLIYVANWPENRKEVWNTLLKARAIENQAYVVGVNRIGTDGNGISYSGDSAVIDPRGKIISSIAPYGESAEVVSISLDDLNDFRNKFPVHLDADDFQIFRS